MQGRWLACCSSHRRSTYIASTWWVTTGRYRGPVTPEIFDILSRSYGYRRGRAVKTPTQEDLDQAAAAGFSVGQMQTFAHDDLVRRARQAAGRLTEGDVTEAFVAGVGGSAVRGRQLLISFLWARQLTEHAYEGTHVCHLCGLAATDSLDVTNRRLVTRHGSVWNEQPIGWALDVEDAVEPGVPAPIGEDREVLRNLLVTAAGMPGDATPSVLEKELAKARIVPRADKYARLGILEALAEAGVLPNGLLTPTYDRLPTRPEVWEASRRLRGSSRSDIVLPFGAWRGSDGVDWDRADRLFAIAAPA